MSHAYTEDPLVEQPAIGLFEALGWETVSAVAEIFRTSGTLGRLAKSEVGQVELVEKELFHSNSMFHHLGETGENNEISDCCISLKMPFSPCDEND